MKSSVILIAVALFFGTGALNAQTAATSAPQPAAASAATALPPSSREHGVHVLPPGAREKLNLTADQVTQIAALEAQVKTSLEKILTPEQLKALATMHPPRGRGGRRGNPEDAPPPPST